MREKPLILIADDDNDFRGAVSSTLQSAGFDVVEARNGNEVLNKAKSVVPDLLILDINMPGGPNGVEVALELKEMPETKNLKIVFLSGLDNPWPALSGEKSEVSKELGMEDFFVKTKDLSQLVEKIQVILQQNPPPLPPQSSSPL